eukprot:gene7759-7958_t
MQRRQRSADVQCDCASQQQMERQQVSPPILASLRDSQDSVLQASPANLADVATPPQDDAAAGAPCTDEWTGAAGKTAGKPSTFEYQFEAAEVSPGHQNSGAALLLIPETQAEPDDVTWAAAELPQTPMSSKHYASQQARVHQALAAVKQQQTKKDRREQSAADLVPDDPAWCNQQHVDDTQQQQQQHDAQQVVQTHSVGSYSRLTASSGGHSPELVRLRRRDGCRRQGRILVSELPDQSQWELEDSDCEVYSHNGNRIATIRNSDQLGCSLTSPPPPAAAAALGTALPTDMRSNFRPHNQGPDHVMNSPVHSCSGSSLPAHSNGDDELVVAGPLMSPAARVVADCDAASVVVAMAGRPTSARGAPVSAMISSATEATAEDGPLDGVAECVPARSGGRVVPLKLLSKAPRGSTAKAAHGLKSSSKLSYAEQVQVPWAHATFSTKEKSNAKDLRGLAKAAEAKLHLPADFQIDFELLRGMTHEHVSMRQVQGEFKLSKVRKAPGGARSRVNPFFWRFSFDTSSCQVLTDRPVTDYVMQ